MNVPGGGSSFLGAVIYGVIMRFLCLGSAADVFLVFTVVFTGLRIIDFLQVILKARE